MTNYVRKSKQKATVANAKEIWTVATELIASDEDAALSFYNTNHSVVVYEVTPEGYVVKDHGNNKHPRPDDPNNYIIMCVTRINGAKGEMATDQYTWQITDPKYETYTKALRKQWDLPDANTRTDGFKIKMPYTGREDGGVYALSKWIIAYNIDNVEQIQVFAGDGNGKATGAVYRVYPDPHENYSTSSH